MCRTTSIQKSLSGLAIHGRYDLLYPQNPNINITAQIFDSVKNTEISSNPNTKS